MSTDYIGEGMEIWNPEETKALFETLESSSIYAYSKVIESLNPGRKFNFTS